MNTYEIVVNEPLDAVYYNQFTLHPNLVDCNMDFVDGDYKTIIIVETTMPWGDITRLAQNHFGPDLVKVTKT